ncbi:hypothetical protein Ahy_B05g078310 [Arachis hypogaea]|uniref:Uncharacterized protein n=1 Tax=Arachis hypogaea TaxID=3818 RepID=A0A444Z6S5_ARAHY|nr:hypothetical protein Ahy_B05g078310 [Arachis hypogaea]
MDGRVLFISQAKGSNSSSVKEDFDEFSDVDELYSSLPLDKILLQSPLGYLRVKGKSNVHDFILAAQACIPIISAVLVEIKNQSAGAFAAPASSSRDKSAASNSSEHPSEPKRKRGRESKHYWTIDAIDEYGASTRLHLLVKDVHNLPEGLRIVVTFDKHHAAIGEAAGLLAGVCGQLATDCVAFPISFEKWSDIPKSFFENQWNIFFLTEETGKEVSRVQMWDITHKKTDGSYVNEKAKEIAEGGKIPIQLAGMFPTQQVSQGLDQESEIPSPKELGSRSSGASNKEA